MIHIVVDLFVERHMIRTYNRPSRRNYGLTRSGSYPLYGLQPCQEYRFPQKNLEMFLEILVDCKWSNALKTREMGGLTKMAYKRPRSSGHCANKLLFRCTSRGKLLIWKRENFAKFSGLTSDYEVKSLLSFIKVFRVFSHFFRCFHYVSRT